jgi:hypothetical protein
MRRSVVTLVVLCLLLAVPASASPSDGEALQLRRRDPIQRVIRIVKTIIRSLGDGIVTPRP